MTPSSTPHAADVSGPTFPRGLEPPTATDPGHIGQYRVVGRLGAGGMGVVYGALDAGGHCLAVKVVHREYAADPDFRARFAREVELVRRVRASCAPAFVAADTAAERPWLATGYVPGPTLRAHVAAHGPLRDGMLLGLAAGMAEALHAIHAAGVLHRDLKPSNVILAPDGPKVLDFGIARAVDDSGITRTGGLVGSPGWVAPERYRGAEATGAADVFSWGALLAFAAAGRAPFGTGAPNVVAYRTMREDPDLDGVPDDLRPLVARALAREPDERPGTAELLREVGTRWDATLRVEDEATEVVSPLLQAEWTDVGSGGHDPRRWAALAPPVRRWRLRRPLVVAAAAGAVLLAGGTLALAASSGWLGTGGDPASDGTATDDVEGGSGRVSGDGTAGGDSASGDTSAEGAGGDGVDGEDIPEWLLDEETVTAENPGVFGHDVAGERLYEVTLDGVTESGAGLEFTGTATYLADSGSREISVIDFYLVDPATPEGPSAGDVPAEYRAYPESDQGFGPISPDDPERSFSFTVSGPAATDPGAVVFETGDGRHNPHLCYRTAPFQTSETQFLANHWRSWEMCTAGNYD